MILKLKMRIFELGITQKRLAEKVGVTQATMSDIIRGKTKPTLDVALLIAREVGMTVEEIWGKSKD